MRASTQRLIAAFFGIYSRLLCILFAAFPRPSLRALCLSQPPT